MSSSPRSLPALDFTHIGPAVGERFPEVALPNQHGEIVKLHQARAGRQALIVIYRSASW
ncbi:MAG TPA: hypothetical protein VMW65_17620 [Chloroflexota bacterium]|nr:hypothetical protein [Chloroflexota bacterium]